MFKKYHSVIIGGGCLGTSTAISIAQNLKSTGKDVCIIEKGILCGGVSSKHSGIIRSANSSIKAAVLAEQANNMWENIHEIWGTEVKSSKTGAIWIAQNNQKESGKTWKELEKKLNKSGIEFSIVKGEQLKDLTHNAIRIDENNEIYFYEPNARIVDPIDVRNALYKAIKIHGIDLHENTVVTGFEAKSKNKINKIKTNKGIIIAENIINAAGGWSPHIFNNIGLQIPVTLHPVYVSNWLISKNKLPTSYPIIADYLNLAYFRTWRDGELHMHQPRQRSSTAIARAFAEEPTAMKGSDIMFDSSNYTASYAETNKYAEMIRDRFPNSSPFIFSGGYISFFDITPDLKFILGKDNNISNLYHCLGAGQSFKYTPIFGKILGELVVNKEIKDKRFNIDEFSIKRFSGSKMKDFWNTVEGSQNTL
jgi:glycine/D-amino acid oxidase-like deaminating enzyme